MSNFRHWQQPLSTINVTSNMLYIFSGTQIVCTTQEASEGDYKVTVRVQRGDEIAEPLLSDQIFTYAHPIVNSIEPMQGPKAGGTKIMILGSNLDISSPGIVNVFIGDIECDVQYVHASTTNVYAPQIETYVIA